MVTRENSLSNNEVSALETSQSTDRQNVSDVLSSEPETLKNDDDDPELQLAEGDVRPVESIGLVECTLPAETEGDVRCRPILPGAKLPNVFEKVSESGSTAEIAVAPLIPSAVSGARAEVPVADSSGRLKAGNKSGITCHEKMPDVVFEKSSESASGTPSQEVVVSPLMMSADSGSRIEIPLADSSGVKESQMSDVYSQKTRDAVCDEVLLLDVIQSRDEKELEDSNSTPRNERSLHEDGISIRLVETLSEGPTSPPISSCSGIKQASIYVKYLPQSSDINDQFLSEPEKLENDAMKSEVLVPWETPKNDPWRNEGWAPLADLELEAGQALTNSECRLLERSPKDQTKPSQGPCDEGSSTSSISTSSECNIASAGRSSASQSGISRHSASGASNISDKPPTAVGSSRNSEKADSASVAEDDSRGVRGNAVELCSTDGENSAEADSIRSTGSITVDILEREVSGRTDSQHIASAKLGPTVDVGGTSDEAWRTGGEMSLKAESILITGSDVAKLVPGSQNFASAELVPAAGDSNVSDGATSNQSVGNTSHSALPQPVSRDKVQNIAVGTVPLSREDSSIDTDDDIADLDTDMSLLAKSTDRNGKVIAEVSAVPPIGRPKSEPSGEIGPGEDVANLSDEQLPPVLDFDSDFTDDGPSSGSRAGADGPQNKTDPQQSVASDSRIGDDLQRIIRKAAAAVESFASVKDHSTLSVKVCGKSGDRLSERFADGAAQSLLTDAVDEMLAVRNHKRSVGTSYLVAVPTPAVHLSPPALSDKSIASTSSDGQV